MIKALVISLIILSCIIPIIIGFIENLFFAFLTALICCIISSSIIALKTNGAKKQIA